jgi:hypothetical protein
VWIYVKTKKQLKSLRNIQEFSIEKIPLIITLVSYKVTRHICWIRRFVSFCNYVQKVWLNFLKNILNFGTDVSRQIGNDCNLIETFEYEPYSNKQSIRNVWNTQYLQAGKEFWVIKLQQAGYY